VLDLHRAPGFSFNTPDENILFTDENCQQRFIAIWREFARRYRDEGQNIVFELLNEIVEPDSTRWNKLATRTIKAIREIDSEHYIVVGGIDYNNVWRLKDMPVFDDEKIIYNFHMYEPFALTHQHASWTVLKDFNRDVAYPGSLDVYKEFVDYVTDDLQKRINSELTYMGAGYVRTFLQPAKEFIEKNDLPLYCGEYGVIDFADVQSRANWTRDVADFCIENGIGRAIWSYKGMNFTMIGRDGKALSESLVRAASIH